jgi:hypothetical protein
MEVVKDAADVSRSRSGIHQSSARLGVTRSQRLRAEQMSTSELADVPRYRLQITMLDSPHHKSIAEHSYNTTNFKSGKLHGVLKYK